MIGIYDSSSEEDNSDSGKGSQIFKDISSRLRSSAQLDTLEQQELCAINVKKVQLQKEIHSIPKLMGQLKIMKQEEIESKVMLWEAAYTELQRELSELEVKSKKKRNKMEELEQIITYQQKIYSLSALYRVVERAL